MIKKIILFTICYFKIKLEPLTIKRQEKKLFTNTLWSCVFDVLLVYVQILGNFSSVHLSHVELKHMGQQQEKGRYPVNFHRCGDVDQRGGYIDPAYVDSLSIHHSFSRCVAIHATNGLLVREKDTE